MLDDTQILRVTGAKLQDLHGDVAVPLGQHALDAEIRLRITGIVEQTPEQLAAPVVNIPLTAVLALVGERLGIGAAKLYDLVLDAALQAHETGDPVSQWMDCSQRALSAAKQRVAELLPRQRKRGPLRRIVELSEIDIHGAGLTAPAGTPKRRKARA